jgi:hypothetical protein
VPAAAPAPEPAKRKKLLSTTNEVALSPAPEIRKPEANASKKAAGSALRELFKSGMLACRLYPSFGLLPFNLTPPQGASRFRFQS